MAFPKNNLNINKQNDKDACFRILAALLLGPASRGDLCPFSPVNLLVLLQHLLEAEALLAHGAAVGSEGGVGRAVVDQALRVGEALVAVGAGEQLVPAVDRAVPLQARGGAAGEATVRAQEGALFDVRALVPVQAFEEEEALPALAAHVAALSLLRHPRGALLWPLLPPLVRRSTDRVLQGITAEVSQGQLRLVSLALAHIRRAITHAVEVLRVFPQRAGRERGAAMGKESGGGQKICG